MGAKLEICISSSSWIGTIVDHLRTITYFQDIRFLGATIVHRWDWSNALPVISPDICEKELSLDDVLYLDFLSPAFGHVGSSIEKMELGYRYTIWIDTAYFPKMDHDVIDKTNRNCYDAIYHQLSRFITEINLRYHYIAIGIEQALGDNRNIPALVASSRNVAVWILPKCYEDVFKSYTVQYHSDLCGWIYERN